MIGVGHMRWNLTVAALALGCACLCLSAVATPSEVICAGDYPWHLQGVATDGNNLFWSFTTVLVKTDFGGKVLGKAEIARSEGHMGDLCCRDGTVFLGMNREGEGGVRRGDEVWAFNAATLACVKKYPTPEAVWCNNGIEWCEGSFWVISSAPKRSEYNYLFEYSPAFKFRTCRLVKSGWTNLGVQTILRFGDELLLGCYGSDDPDDLHPPCVLRVAVKDIVSSQKARDGGPIPCLGREPVNTAEGMLVLDGKLWKAHSVLLSPAEEKKNRRWTGRLIPVPEFADRRVPEKPMVIFNEDDSHYLAVRPVEAFRAYIDEVCRGTVTHFFMCPNAMRSNIDTKSIEPIWTALDEPFVKPDGRCAAGKTLHERGIDMYAIWIARCREKGVSPWITMRMNDQHFVTTPSYCALSRFWRAHPEFRRVTTPVQEGSWRWGDYVFDYAHKEVRDYYLAYVKELLERYDVDGFECDWMRGTSVLKEGREREDARFMTEFMREVRRLANAAALRRGHPVGVSVRVPTTRKGGLHFGLDAVEWAKEGLVDLIVPCNDFYSVDWDIPIREWEKQVAAVNSKVKVIPGCDSNVRKVNVKGGRSQPLTVPEYRAWGEKMFAEGAKGLYFFNLFYVPETNGVWDAVLDGETLPGMAEAGKRVYPKSYRDWPDPKFEDLDFPVTLDKPRTVAIGIGQPPRQGRAAVRLAFAGPADEAFLKGVRLNGVMPSDVADVSVSSWIQYPVTAKFAAELKFPVHALKCGVNEIAIPAGDAAKMCLAAELEIDPMRHNEWPGQLWYGAWLINI